MVKKLIDLIRRFLGIFHPALRKSPEELLEEERRALRQRLATFNQGLALHASHSQKLIGRVDELRRREAVVRDRIKADLGEGRREAAGLAALELRQVVTEQHRLGDELAEAELGYRSVVDARDAAVRAVKTRIDQLEHDLDTLKVHQATAELTELASDTVDGSGRSTLARLQETVAEERGRAVGRARVAGFSLEVTDPGSRGFGGREQADQALADFAASEGITLEGHPPRDDRREYQ